MNADGTLWVERSGRPPCRLGSLAPHRAEAALATIAAAHKTTVFGQIKQARGFRQFLLRSLEKVQAEWSIVCTAHNLLKLAQRRTLSALRSMALEARPAVA